MFLAAFETSDHAASERRQKALVAPADGFLPREEQNNKTTAVFLLHQTKPKKTSEVTMSLKKQRDGIPWLALVSYY